MPERKDEKIKKRKKPDKLKDDDSFDDYEQIEEFNDIIERLERYFSKYMPGFDFQKIIKQFSQQFNLDPNSLNDLSQSDLNKILMDLTKGMKIDPNQLPQMNKEAFQKMIKNNMQNMKKGGPFIFGVNMKMNKDGKFVFDSFGNVKQKPHGETEVKMVREPMIDIIDDDPEEIIVVAEVPGVIRDDIELKANERSITIIANEKDSYGNLTPKYKTTVDLDCSINPDKAHASLKNGILEIKLEKSKNKGSNISID